MRFFHPRENRVVALRQRPAVRRRDVPQNGLPGQQFPSPFSFVHVSFALNYNNHTKFYSLNLVTVKIV